MSNNLKQNFFFQLGIQSIPLILLLVLIFKGQANIGIVASSISIVFIRIIFRKDINEGYSVNKKQVLSFAIVGWAVVLLGSVGYIYLSEKNSDLLKVIKDAWDYYIYPFIFIFGFLMGIPFILYLFLRGKERK